MSLIFAIENIDGEDLVLEVLGELLVFSHFASLQRINFLFDSEASVENLLVSWLGRSN